MNTEKNVVTFVAAFFVFMRTIVIILLLMFKVGYPQNVRSPKDYIYDNDLLTAEFHKERREALRALMDSNSVAVFFSNPIRNRSNDVNFEFHQDPNLYYLTGLTEPHSLLVVFKEEKTIDSIITNEILFVQPRDPANEIWDGRRLGVAGAKDVLGVNTAIENFHFPDIQFNFNKYSKVYFDLPHEDIRDNDRNRGDLFSLVKHFKSKTDTLLNESNAMETKEVMARLRQIKLTEELTLMINAIDFTCEAQKELMRVLEPGMFEYEAESVIEYVFKVKGAEYPGFPSILGGGENSCTLHYTTNRRQLKYGDLLVSDIGAEYHGYTADVTRTLPASGKFTEEQKIIYNLVLKAQEAGIKASIEGNKFWEPGTQAKDIIAQGLLELGVIKEYKEVKKYFMHGTSHYLGLDVHDVGLYGNLKPGMVITVEPGIYIAEGSDCDPKWWNIGVRIEDDVLITDSEPEVLSGCVVKKVEEIEALMQEEPKIFK